jgi:hypothetical protein
MAEVVTERWVVYTDRDPFSEDADEDLYSDNEVSNGEGRDGMLNGSVSLTASIVAGGSDCMAPN